MDIKELSKGLINSAQTDFEKQLPPSWVSVVIAIVAVVVSYILLGEEILILVICVALISRLSDRNSGSVVQKSTINEADFLNHNEPDPLKHPERLNDPELRKTYYGLD